MIRITVELFPKGFEVNKTVIGHAEIWNDLSGTPEHGNYKFRLYGKRNRLMRTGEIKGFPRKSHHVWQLIQAMLERF